VFSVLDVLGRSVADHRAATPMSEVVS
jgi:hypothetical protein